MGSETDREPIGDSLGQPREILDLRIPAALVRTALSSEQTLMSWIRTSLSLCTFGFSIATFFDYLAQYSESPHGPGPRRLGIALIGIGVTVLMVAITEHLRRIRQLRVDGLPDDAGSYVPVGSAAAMLAIGLAALVSIFLGWKL